MAMMGLSEVTAVMVMSAGPWTLTRHHPRKDATLGGWRAWLVRAVAPRKAPSQMSARQLPFVYHQRGVRGIPGGVGRWLLQSWSPHRALLAENGVMGFNGDCARMVLSCRHQL